jgi:hypothetical protein
VIRRPPAIAGWSCTARAQRTRCVARAGRLEAEVGAEPLPHERAQRLRAAVRRRGELEGSGISELPKVVLADSGYWHTEQMHQLAADAIPVLIPPESGLRTTPRPGWRGGYFSFMRGVLASEHGASLYKLRQHLIETLFGSIKHNRGIDRFHRRGRAAVRTEWRMINATHNLAKLHKHQLAAAVA